MLERLHLRIGDVLSEVRQLSDEEFERYKDELAEKLVVAVLAPEGGRPGRMEPGSGVAWAEKPMTPEERTRSKMQMAAEPYLLLKRLGADTTELDLRFQQARQALVDADYDKAEQLVDDSLDMMREMLAQQQTTSEHTPGRDNQLEGLDYSTPITESE